MEYWNGEIMEYWNDGIMMCGSEGMVGLTIIPGL
jgi:hypothetical protein